MRKNSGSAKMLQLRGESDDAQHCGQLYSVLIVVGGGDVVLPLHGPALLGLLYLQLWEQTDEPLEGPLLTVDPVEVNL